MAIQVNGTEVISNSRALNNIASVDATTAAAIGAAGVGGGPSWSLVQTSTISSVTGITGGWNMSNTFSYTVPSGVTGMAISFTVGSVSRNYNSGGTQQTGLFIRPNNSDMTSQTYVAAAPANWSGGSATYIGQSATVSTVASNNGYDGLNGVLKNQWSAGYRAVNADPNYSPHESGANPGAGAFNANEGDVIYYTVTPFDHSNPQFAGQVTANNVIIKVWELS